MSPLWRPNGEADCETRIKRRRRVLGMHSFSEVRWNQGNRRARFRNDRINIADSTSVADPPSHKACRATRRTSVGPFVGQELEQVRPCPQNALATLWVSGGQTVESCLRRASGKGNSPLPKNEALPAANNALGRSRSVDNTSFARARRPAGARCSSGADGRIEASF